MTDNVPQIYTERDLAKAKRNAKVVGFVQGGFAVFLVGLVVKFLSWMPFVLGAGVVGFVGYKLLTRGSKEEPEEVEV